MNLLVIVVTYNAMQWAERCFDSLQHSTIKPDVYVVDNGSTDGTQLYIQNHYPNVRFYQSNTNLGFGKANNIGLQYALNNDYEYVYLLNQDAWVMEDTFEKLVEFSKQYPEYGILSPFQMNSDLYHIDNNFVAGVCSWYSNNDIFSDIYNGKTQHIYRVPVVMAAHWFLTRRCIETVGGFSPSFVHYSEDDNYCDRTNYHNIFIGIIPSLTVVHDRSLRTNTHKKDIYLSYTESIRVISCPGTNKYDSMFSCILYITYISFKNARKYCSLLPIKYGVNLLRNIKNIHHNRMISKNIKCSFLSY